MSSQRHSYRLLAVSKARLNIYYLRASRLQLSKVGLVDFIHLGKVRHVGEEDIDLNTLIQAATCGIKDRGEVLDALVLPTISFCSPHSEGQVGGTVWA